jgi:hypothetical protein
MNYEMIAAILIVAIFIGIIGAMVAKDIRHAYLVSEGYVGLLYHKGKFLEVLGAGRHIRWGRHFTLGVNDLRKTSLLVAGQDVLTTSASSSACLSRIRSPTQSRPRTKRSTGRATFTTRRNSLFAPSSAAWLSKRCSTSDSKSARSSWPGCSLKPRSSASPSTRLK